MTTDGNNLKSGLVPVHGSYPVPERTAYGILILKELTAPEDTTRLFETSVFSISFTRVRHWTLTKEDESKNSIHIRSILILSSRLRTRDPMFSK
jgi:hypothetical protein